MRTLVGALALAAAGLAGAAGAFAQSDEDIAEARRGAEGRDEADEDEAPKPLRGEPVEAVAARLKANGPEVAAGTRAGLGSVQGFVRNGWPVVVDFEPQPGTRTDLVISIYEPDLGRILFPRKTRLVMDEGGEGGRQLFTGVIDLPADAEATSGGAVGVARYTVVSRRLKPGGKPSKEEVPATVYGIGAGPRAVGSITVTDVALGTGVTRLRLPASGRIPLPYRYRLKASFDHVVEDVRRDCKGFFCSKSVIKRHARITGARNGSLAIDKPAFYRFTVRAWLSCPTPDFKACEDEAAWATGQSARIQVVK